MNTEITVGFVLQDNPNASSRKYAYMLAALEEQGLNVARIFPVGAPVLERVMQYLGRVSWIIFRKRIASYHTRAVSKRQSAKLDKLIVQHSPDLLVAPFASTAIAFSSTLVPIVYVSDSTFSNMIDYYPRYTRLWPFSVRSGNEIEKRAINKSALLVFSSDWASESAVRDYGASPCNTMTVPFGANIASGAARQPQNLAPGKRITLLFLAVDWWRKGGDIAVKVTSILNKRGVPAQLVICGVTPPKRTALTFTRVIPYLDKNDPRQYHEYELLLRSTDFLLLPVRADCTPHVFAEASSYGIPSVTTRTGGVPAMVRNGHNGLLVDFDETGLGYADAIQSCIDQGDYASLSRGSLSAFASFLNWKAWSASLVKAIGESAPKGGHERSEHHG